MDAEGKPSKTLARQDTVDECEEIPVDQNVAEDPSTTDNEPTTSTEFAATSTTKDESAKPTQEGTESTPPAPKRKAVHQPSSILVRMLTSDSSEYETIYDVLRQESSSTDVSSGISQDIPHSSKSTTETETNKNSDNKIEVEENKENTTTSITEGVSSQMDTESKVESGASALDSDSKEIRSSCTTTVDDDTTLSETTGSDACATDDDSNKAESVLREPSEIGVVTDEPRRSSSGSTTDGATTQQPTASKKQTLAQLKEIVANQPSVYSMSGSDISTPRNEQPTSPEEDLSTKCGIDCFCLSCSK